MDWFDRKIVEYVVMWTPASLARARSRIAAPQSMPMSHRRVDLVERLRLPLPSVVS